MDTPNDERPERLVRFDCFEVDLRSGELRKDGARLRLAEQPFYVLALLLRQPGELVTRDELQKKLWPGNTFTDFDRGLNKAVNRLRDALGDSVEAPRFIETLPKRGYRFIGQLANAGGSTVSASETPMSPAQEVATPSAAPAESVLARKRQFAAWAAATAVFAGIAIVAAMWWLSGSDPTRGAAEPLIRSSLLPPPGRMFVPHSVALSRDGTHLAFVAEGPEGTRSLWVRSMSSTSATAVAGTEGASLPFWSADMRQVAFFAEAKLKVVDLAGGAIRAIADVRRPSGGSWNRDDVIVFAPDVNGALYRIAAAGGTPVAITRVAEGHGLRGHRWPVFLPDEQHFVYVSFSDARPSDNEPELLIGSLDSPESKAVDWLGSRSVAYALDHLLYVRGGTLYAQPFDGSALRTRGPPVAVAGVELAGAPAFYPSPLTASMNGVLVFQSAVDLPSRLVWLDDHGRETGALPGMKYGGPAISPDGRFVAGSCEGAAGGTLAICVSDLERGMTTRITDGPSDRFPVWSRDGGGIAYSSGSGIHVVRADGSGVPQLVSRRGIPTGWTSDGRILSFGSHNGIVALALSSPQTHEVTELEQGAEGQLSPDGSWLAFIAPGGLVVQQFPGPGTRVTIAATGVAQPRWSRDGSRLFYISADKTLMSVDFDPASGRAGATQPVSQTRIVGAALVGHQYDVAPDGRFIVNTLTSEVAPLTLMSGWTSRLATALR